MNQMGWKGAIADHETTYSYNMSTTTDGEWKKRKGYVQLVTLPTGSVGETTKLLWRTNDITDAAEDTDIAANVWLANSSETNGHRILTTTTMTRQPGDYSLDSGHLALLTGLMTMM
jgi:hypothetical protein